MELGQLIVVLQLSELAHLEVGWGAAADPWASQQALEQE
jgi:hypothetical protein